MTDRARANAIVGAFVLMSVFILVAILASLLLSRNYPELAPAYFFALVVVGPLGFLAIGLYDNYWKQRCWWVLINKIYYLLGVVVIGLVTLVVIGLLAIGFYWLFIG